MFRSAVRSAVLSLAVAALSVTAAFAQGQLPGPPGQAQVTVQANCSATLAWAPAANATRYMILAQLNNVTLPGSPFDVGNLLAVNSGPIPPGNYLVAILAMNSFGQTQGAVSAFTIPTTCGGTVPPPGPTGPPATPTLRQPVVTGNNVTLIVDPAGTGGAATSYDIEAIVQSTGQRFELSIGQTTTTVPNVPAGNFLVRARARNAFGISDWSQQRQVVVGVTLGSGDMQVTLTWNSQADIDLHVIEPDGTHVWYASKVGRTARLDVDDVNGFGPENVFVSAGGAAAGTYQVYVVHYGLSTPTTSTITVRLNAGTANERVALFTRQTSAGNPGVGFNVALVDVRNGIITETAGTRDEDRNALTAAKSGSQ